MNHRVLELLKTPKSIQSEDLHLLKEEINSFPYIQNIRALYLYGVHLYDKDNYQKVLSTTAAYTTDKKILYQLINGKIQQKTKVGNPTEKVTKKIVPTENPLQLLLRSKASAFPLKREEAIVETPIVDAQPAIDDQQSFKEQESFGIAPVPKPETKQVFVNGERNRILFEGEEDYLENDDVEIIDLESTLESGSIITYKAENKEQPQIHDEEIREEKENHTENDENFTAETIIEEEKITQEAEKEEVLNSSELSFHETETFLPDIQISSNDEQKKGRQDEISSLNNTEEVADFTHEKIIHEDEILSSKEEESVNNEAELSFHGMESFLPEVKIEANKTEERIAEISQSNVSKHEDEMRRLIEEVEKKMKEKTASEKPEKQEEPENTGHDISFAETQSFEVKPQPEVEEEAKEIIAETSEELKEEPAENNTDTEEKQVPEVHSAWKPMSFESNLPDSLLNKAEEKPTEVDIQSNEKGTEEIKNEPKEETVSEPEHISEPIETDSEIIEIYEANQAEEIQQEARAESKEEAPVMNVSFFGSGWTIAQPEKQQESHQEEEKIVPESENAVEKQKSATLDSNIPGFINTWQSWLKIDRSQEVQKEKAEIKNKVIETFIETNPKISQLKEESNFVVKEKGDDISHLMTETLANLYFEQKLYTKAIKAFEILIKKTPEKKGYYEGRIQEIKDFRTKG